MSTQIVPDLKVAAVSGGAAGNITVTGIRTGDKLLSVTHLDFTLAEGTPNTRTWVKGNLVGEFSITAADTINNAGGTVTTGGILLVIYVAADPLGGSLNRA